MDEMETLSDRSRYGEALGQLGVSMMVFMYVNVCTVYNNLMYSNLFFHTERINFFRCSEYINPIVGLDVPKGLDTAVVQDPGAWYVRACPGVKRAFEEVWETPEPCKEDLPWIAMLSG